MASTLSLNVPTYKLNKPFIKSCLFKNPSFFLSKLLNNFSQIKN